MISRVGRVLQTRAQINLVKRIQNYRQNTFLGNRTLGRRCSRRRAFSFSHGCCQISYIIISRYLPIYCLRSDGSNKEIKFLVTHWSYSAGFKLQIKSNRTPTCCDLWIQGIHRPRHERFNYLNILNRFSLTMI